MIQKGYDVVGVSHQYVLILGGGKSDMKEEFSREPLITQNFHVRETRWAGSNGVGVDVKTSLGQDLVYRLLR